MEVEVRSDGRTERKVLIGMIVDRYVLAQIAARWRDPGLFRSDWANLVGGWCVGYYKKYSKAPKASIEGLFESWSEAGRDKDTVKIVERFLEGLSGEYSALAKARSSEYTLDMATRHFNRVRLLHLAESIKGLVEGGDLMKADTLVRNSNPLAIGASTGIDLLTDRESVRQAFEARLDPIVTYPGPLGEFFKGQLERDAFIAFMGKEKSGKTFWLIDVAWRAIRQNRKVAFFEIGDLSQNQIVPRFCCRNSRRPMKAETVRYPTSIVHDPDEGVSSVKYESLAFDEGLNWRAAWKDLEKKWGKTKEDSLLKLSCHPNFTINIQGIAGILEQWEREGWVPDVIVIDYADILAPMAGYKDSREAVNASWQMMRSLSQTYHCLLVTASQTNTASYRAEVMEMSHFSEDKRKLAHVTGAVGINQSDEDKEQQICRLNWMVLREAEFHNKECVYCAGALALAMPCVKSCW
jgi:hypothetical protein